MERKLYTYDEIAKLVKAYQSGDRTAGGELFKAFKGFIAKYSNFLRYGGSGRGDRDIQGLAYLLCPKGDSVRARLSLIRAALASYEFEDIVGEMNLLFLEALDEFRARKSPMGGDVPLAGYLYSTFKFRVKRWIDNKLKDAMNTVSLEEITEEEKEMQMLEDTKEFEEQFSRVRPILDQVTRWILHLYYSKGLKDREIGNLIKVSGNWICGQRRAALQKLREAGIDQAEELIRANKL